jgi:hypothetical protein
MDRHKITFECIAEPDSLSGLEGFVKDGVYEGRAFNGLYEVTPRWGRELESKLISKKIFERYFKELKLQELIRKPA